MAGTMAATPRPSRRATRETQGQTMACVAGLRDLQAHLLESEGVLCQGLGAAPGGQEGG